MTTAEQQYNLEIQMYNFQMVFTQKASQCEFVFLWIQRQVTVKEIFYVEAAQVAKEPSLLATKYLTIMLQSQPEQAHPFCSAEFQAVAAPSHSNICIPGIVSAWVPHHYLAKRKPAVTVQQYKKKPKDIKRFTRGRGINTAFKNQPQRTPQGSEIKVHYFNNLANTCKKSKKQQLSKNICRSLSNASSTYSVLCRSQKPSCAGSKIVFTFKKSESY